MNELVHIVHYCIAYIYVLNINTYKHINIYISTENNKFDLKSTDKMVIFQIYNI